MAEENTVEKTDVEAEPIEEATESTVVEDSSKQIDYEAELKRERERREAAEKAAADAAFKLRERKRKGEDVEEDEVDEDAPLTGKQLQDILRKEREQTKKELNASSIALKAREIAGSDSEAQLIIEIHKNRSFPDGLSLDEQIEEAYAIANRHKIVAENSDLKRALRGKDTISTNVAGTHRDSPALDEPKLSQGDVGAIKAAGFIWDGKTRLYVKKLPTGRTLSYNPKTKAQKLL